MGFPVAVTVQMSDSTVISLKKYGFAKSATKILSSSEAVELSQLINELFKDESVIDRKIANAAVILNLPGMNPRLDWLLEKIVSHDGVRSVLSQVLGDDYKVWQVNARRSHIGDTGLWLHQDGPGETNLAVFLSDNMSGAGATAFLAMSHKLPRSASRISWSSLRFAAPWLTPLKGKLGEVAFFFNRTWHARLKNNSSHVQDVILISFFPQGGVFLPYKQSQERLKSWDGWELGRLFDLSKGAQLLGDGRVQVVSPWNKQVNGSYAMLLECAECNVVKEKVVLLFFKVIFLELAFRPLYLIYRLFKPLSHPGK